MNEMKLSQQRLERPFMNRERVYSLGFSHEGLNLISLISKTRGAVHILNALGKHFSYLLEEVLVFIHWVGVAVELLQLYKAL